MTRQRLRPAYSPEQLAKVYPEPHQHTRFRDHLVRVGVTREIAMGVLHHDDTVKSVADLSCGDASIAKHLGLQRTVLGDFAPGYELTGPLETTLDQLEPVDIYICSETLEHLDDPDLVLKKIRQKTRYLVLSTPVEAWNEDNPEHYWAWSRADVEAMLRQAGFSVLLYNPLDMRKSWSCYCYGIWVTS